MPEQPPHTTLRALALLGDSGDINAWSNIPYFLTQAGKRAGFITHTLDLMPPDYHRRRLIWSALAPLRLERPGGYQYSRTNVNQMWERVPPELRRGEIISHYQAFPPLDRSTAAGVRHSFYCDATLTQLFSGGGQGGGLQGSMGGRTRADVLRRERELYHAARFCVAMARATAESFVNDYQVDPAKVFVVRAGANLDEVAVRAFLEARGPSWRERGEEFSAERPARLGFVGRDYLRKGLPRLVQAAEILHARGRPVRVAVIGHCPEDLRRHPQVEWLGFVHKARDTGRFLAAVDTFALGCLPSYVEPLGISTLECLRLGVPVMGTAVGGIPDCVPPDGGFLVSPGADGGEIADAVERHVFAPDRYAAMVAGAVAESPNTTWDGAVRKLQAIWAGGAQHYAGRG